MTDRLHLHPIPGRGSAGKAFKNNAEVLGMFETTRLGNLRQLFVGLQKHGPRMMQLFVAQHILGTVPEMLAEAALQGTARQVRMSANLFNV